MKMELPDNVFDSVRRAANKDEQQPVPHQDLLWERIEARLEEKQQVKRIPFYLQFSFRYVAAVAVGIFGIGLILNFLLAKKSGEKFVPLQPIIAVVKDTARQEIIASSTQDAIANEVFLTKEQPLTQAAPADGSVGSKKESPLKEIPIVINWKANDAYDIPQEQVSSQELFANIVPVDPNNAVIEIKNDEVRPVVKLEKDEARVVTGVVVDKAGVPVAGAVVQSFGKVFAAVTDGEGKFEIRIPKTESQLYVEARGVERTEFLLGQSSDYLVDVAPDKKLVALYSDIQAHHTGKQSGLSKYLANTPQFVAPSHTAKVNAKSRTSNSLLAAASKEGEGKADLRTTKLNNGPLLVVNGVIYEGSLTDINPKHIQETRILGNAEAKLIYGTNAKNGVISITLKKGKKLPK
jgi:hypothetical protein